MIASCVGANDLNKKLTFWEFQTNVTAELPPKQAKTSPADCLLSSSNNELVNAFFSSSHRRCFSSVIFRLL